METKNITLASHVGAPVFTVPVPVYEYLKSQNEWIESLHNSVKRQMIIQVKIGNFFRDKQLVDGQKDWYHFRYHFPSFVAMNGALSAIKLKALVQDWFGLSSVVGNEYALCLPKSYSWKYIEFQDGHNIKATRPHCLVVVPDADAVVTLQRIAEGFIHIGYDFGIINPLDEWYLVM